MARIFLIEKCRSCRSLPVRTMEGNGYSVSCANAGCGSPALKITRASELAALVEWNRANGVPK